MSISRITTLLLWLICMTANAEEYIYEYADDPVESTLIKDLISFQKEAELARENNMPILIEFSTPWCSYCEALEQQVLEPLIMSQEFKDKIIIRKIEVTDFSTVIGFDGETYTAFEINQKYKVKLYPTLVFLDANGNEISQRIVGITVIDFAAESLEKAIAVAIRTNN